MKEIFPLIGCTVLGQINWSLAIAFDCLSYKVAVIKALLKEPSCDPDVLANYMPIYHRSTETCLVKVTKGLLKALDNGLVSIQVRVELLIQLITAFLYIGWNMSLG